MYFRIMNQLDLSCMEKTIHEAIQNPAISEQVSKRIAHCIMILDQAYGCSRSAFDMGGYVFLLTDIRDSAWIREQLLEHYGISAENCEYTNEICREHGVGVWQEELYLRGSDDSIVIIYKKNE